MSDLFTITRSAVNTNKADPIRHRAGRPWDGCVFSISDRHKSNIARRATLIIGSFGPVGSAQHSPRGAELEWHPSGPQGVTHATRRPASPSSSPHAATTTGRSGTCTRARCSRRSRGSCSPATSRDACGETGHKGAVTVDVGDDLRVTRVERLILDEARWLAPVVDLSGIDNRDAALERVRGALAADVTSADGRALALRVTLAGTTPIASKPRRRSRPKSPHRLRTWRSASPMRSGSNGSLSPRACPKRRSARRPTGSPTSWRCSTTSRTIRRP